MSTSDKPIILEPIFDAIPKSLIPKTRFVSVLFEWNAAKEKYAKVPYQPNSYGHKASSTNPATWSTLDAVVRAYTRGLFQGIGYVLGDGIGGIDLDHAFYDDGKLKPWASAILDLFKRTYAELSPS